MGYFYNPPAAREAARPLLPLSYASGQQASAAEATSCFPEADKCCGMSSQRVVLSLAGALAVAIVMALIVLVAADR